MEQNQKNNLGNVQHSSADFGSVPNDSEPFGMVRNDAEVFRKVPHVSERKESHTMTVREVARMFEAAGVARQRGYGEGIERPEEGRVKNADASAALRWPFGERL